MPETNELIAENFDSDENSVIKISTTKMGELGIASNETVFLKGKKDTVCIVLPDEGCQNDKILMNKYVQRNIGVDIGDTVTINKIPDIKYGTNIRILPILDTIQGIDDSIFEVFLKPYFFNTYRPIHKGDIISVTVGSKTIEFKVLDCKPAPFCIVAPETLLHCEGVIKREDAEEEN